MENKVIIIGGGIAGLTAAKTLAESNIGVTLLEKEPQPGGHLKRWDRLFPTLRPGREVLDSLLQDMPEKVSLRNNIRIRHIERNNSHFIVNLDNGELLNANALVIATGFDLFDATRKEEYGYGIYDNVITSADLEEIFHQGPAVLTPTGKIPSRVGFVHCVGSRDEKAGNIYCSKVCCVTGVKQAIEIRQAHPATEVFNFYMDLRMYDRNFEELYLEAQQKWGVNFIRGRVSECSENPDHTIVVKTEDTLTGKPLKINVDLLVLLIGFVPSAETVRLSAMLGLPAGPDRFLRSADEHLADNLTAVPGVFITGAVKGPASIVNTVADARATAVQALHFLQLKTS